MNKAMLTGYVGRDPEVRYTQSGKAVATLSLATQREWKNEKGERQEKTTWHRLKAWGKLAETIGKYVTSGRQLEIEGEIDNDSYTDKDGVQRFTSDILLQRFKFLDKRPAGDSKAAKKTEQDEPQGAETQPEDDIPF